MKSAAVLLTLTLVGACHSPGIPALSLGMPSGLPRPPLPGLARASLPLPSLPVPGRSMPRIRRPRLGIPALPAAGLPLPRVGAPRIPTPRLPVPAVCPPRVSLPMPAIPRPRLSPFYHPRRVFLPGAIYAPGRWAPYYPSFWYYRPIVKAAKTEVIVPDYVAPETLRLHFGDPTIGTDEDLLGDWNIDPRRSAAVMKAWLTHVMRAYGSRQDPDVSALEREFRELDARLSLAADHTYVMTLDPKEEYERIEWRGEWSFVEGVLDIEHTEDVEGIPVESEAVYEFNYYANEAFVGLVVVNHGLGLVMTRSE